MKAALSVGMVLPLEQGRVLSGRGHELPWSKLVFPVGAVLLVVAAVRLAGAGLVACLGLERRGGRGVLLALVGSLAMGAGGLALAPARAATPASREPASAGSEADPPASPWPALARAGEPTESVSEDLDKDGILDHLQVWSSWGSGWSSWATCARHGASGHVACQRWENTVYALVSGGLRVVEPRAGNRAAALVSAPECAPPARARAAQGAMWRLADGDVARQRTTEPT